MSTLATWPDDRIFGTSGWSSRGVISLRFGADTSLEHGLFPTSKIWYPTRRADRTAAPTTVELIAFPARSCNSRCLSLVSNSLFSGSPCRAKASRPQSGPPRVVMYGIPQGVMQPTSPYARLSVSRSRPCERSMHRLKTVNRQYSTTRVTMPEDLLLIIHIVAILAQLPQEIRVDGIPHSFWQGPHICLP